MKLILALVLIFFGLVSLFISILTFAVKAQKYGLPDMWQNPDLFAILTLLLGVVCFIGSYLLLKRRPSKVVG